MCSPKSVLKFTWHLMILTPFLVSIANLNPILSSSLPPVAPQISSTTQWEDDLSTPDLIQQAFLKGEITEEKRLLYLAYALADSEKLPTRYHGKAPWSGTMIGLDLSNELSSKSTKMVQSNSTLTTIQQLLSGDCGPYSGDLPNVAITTHFYIEYNTIAGGLDISNYTASLENVWNVVVDNLGWASPWVMILRAL